jgi:hypothetical protein
MSTHLESVPLEIYFFALASTVRLSSNYPRSYSHPLTFTHSLTFSYPPVYRLSIYHPLFSPTRSYTYVHTVAHQTTGHLSKQQETLKWKLLMRKRKINFEYNGSIPWKLFNIFNVKYFKYKPIGLFVYIFHMLI